MRFDGYKLRMARLGYGMTQERIALLAKVDQSEVSRLEGGHWADSSGAKVTRLVDALNYVERKQADEQGRAPRVWASGDLYDQRHDPEAFDGFKVAEMRRR